MKSVCRIDHLHGHAHLVGGHLDAALEIHRDAQPFTNFLRRTVWRQRKRIAARGDAQPRNARQLRDDIVDKAVGKHLCFAAAIEIQEGQHGKRVLGDRWQLSFGQTRHRLNAFGLRQTNALVIDVHEDSGERERTNNRHIGTAEATPARVDGGDSIDDGASVAELEIPREGDRDRKSGDHEDRYEGGGPVGQMQLRENDVGDLYQQPTEDEISDGGLEDATTLKIFEQADVTRAGAAFRTQDDGIAVIGREFGCDDQPVTASWQGLDKGGVIRMVIERMTNLADGVTEGLLAAFAGAPHGFEQLVAGHKLAGIAGKAKQDLYRLWRYVLRTRRPGDVSF